jgi:hypothetical protein
MRDLFAAAAAIACAAAIPASARDAGFDIDGKAYLVPLPDGYCADGPGADHMRDIASSDPAMRPAVALVRCGQDASIDDYYTVQLDRQDPRTTRAIYLAYMRRTLPDALAKASSPNPKANETIAVRLAEAFDADLSVNGGFHPVGVDDACSYAVGRVHKVIDGAMRKVTMIACASVAGDRVTYLARFIPGDGVAVAAPVLTELRGMLQGIRPAPAR